MQRFRFKINPDDPRPVVWPIKHPYWVTGSNDSNAIVVAYEDSIEEIKRLWPDAEDIDAVDVKEYAFSTRFPKPVWWSMPT